MHHVGCDLRERFQHEATLVKPWMREGQILVVLNDAFKQEQIDVDDSGLTRY